MFSTQIDFLAVLQGNPSSVPGRLRVLFAPETYDDDVLDVSALFPYSLAEKCIIRFNTLPVALSVPCRAFARLEIFFGKAPSTVNSYLGNLTILFNEVLKRGVWDYRMISLDDVNAVVNSGRFSASTCSKMCVALKIFLMVMKSFCGQYLFCMDMDGLDDLCRRYTALESSTRNANKTPDIDSAYFDALEAGLPILVWNESLPINYRMSAAFIWLDMYVGLRLSDAFTLTVNSHVVKTTTTGKRVDYLYYGVPKLSHGGRVKKFAECYMLPGAVTAFEALLKLRKLIPVHEKTDSLFILEGNGKMEHRFRYYKTNIYLKYFKDLCTSYWDNVKKTMIEGQIYYIPNMTQFRVHLCGYLYNEGVRLHIIELGMSHLTKTMLAYYVRVKDKTFKKQNSRVDNIIRSRMNNDFAIENCEEKGEQLLGDLLLSLSRFRTYARMCSRMEEKGYDYEIDRYTKQCWNTIFTEIMPAFGYLDRVVACKGRGNVLKVHPGLRHILENTENILKEIGQWEERHKI